MLLGAVDQASSYIPLEEDFLYYHTGIFAQDDWHITPQLTVSYGIGGILCRRTPKPTTMRLPSIGYYESGSRQFARSAGLCRKRNG